MKSYMLIQGNSKDIEGFEQKVADALEMGYVLAGELVAKSQEGGSAFLLIQPVILDEYDMEEDEEEDEEDEE